MVEMALVSGRLWRVAPGGKEVLSDFLNSLWGQGCCWHFGSEAVESGGIVSRVRCSLCCCYSTLWDRSRCLGVVGGGWLGTVVGVLVCCCLVAVLGGVLVGVPDGFVEVPDLAFFDQLVSCSKCI